MAEGNRLLFLALCLHYLPKVEACPKDCTCYSEPMTVSCQQQGFKSIPEGIPLRSQRIFLQNNKIPLVSSSSFSSRQNLSVLWLHSNNISVIQAGAFAGLERLEELDIGENINLRSLAPTSFRGLVRLHTLHLHRCGLSELPTGIFRGLVSLQYLYLQENVLEKLDDDLFADMGNLTSLFLHGNRIRTLSENAFRGLRSLDKLLLHQNRISLVHSRAFHDLGKLGLLYLFNNNITVLTGQTMDPLISLQYLRLNGNQWMCDCRAKSLWDWFRRFRGSSSVLECHVPPRLFQRDLKTLDRRELETCLDSSHQIRTSIFSTRTRSGKLPTVETPSGARDGAIKCCQPDSEQSSLIYTKGKPAPSSYNGKESTNKPLKDKENISKSRYTKNDLSKNGTYKTGLSDAPVGTFSGKIDQSLDMLSPELLNNLDSSTSPTTKKKRKCYKKPKTDSSPCRLSNGSHSKHLGNTVLAAVCLLPFLLHLW
ncbi:reticulon-4 receptor [Stegostoma tigrinum]|uniref:reticulon-4 receptor n=1 Tax=Stegostoma tigrinum TaxID=3053191 RepID=UPI00202B2D92|nr:reticulon-4 receptor [Stegostoma tigrinum]